MERLRAFRRPYRTPSGRSPSSAPGSGAFAEAMHCLDRPLCDLLKGPGLAALRLREDERPPLLRGLGDDRSERDLAEAFHSRLPDGTVAANVREDLELVPAMRALDGTHVLDRAEDGGPTIPEQRDELLRVEMGDVLGRDDEDGAGAERQPEEVLLEVGRPGRQVDDEVVEIGP